MSFYPNPFINQFPYMDAHEMNLDWIIKTCKMILEKMHGFEAANTVEYKGVWSITSQYTKWSIVLDTQTGYMMISKQPVPLGIDINNPDYWQLVAPFKIDTEFNTNSYNAIANTTVTTKFNEVDTELERLALTDDELNTAINNEVEAREATDQALSDETEARETADQALSNRINTNASDIASETLARQTADNSLSARIDSIIALPDGSTTADAELIDIRIGGNGIDYASAGDAVRGQYEELDTNIKDVLSEDCLIVTGLSINSSGKWDSIANEFCFILPVTPGNTLKGRAGSYGSAITFLKTFVTPIAGETPDYATGYSQIVTKTNVYNVTVPADAAYLVLYKVHNNNNVLPLWLTDGYYDYIKTSIQKYNSTVNNLININSYPTSGYVNTSGILTVSGSWITTAYYPCENIIDIYQLAYQIPNTVAIASFYDENYNFVYYIDTVPSTSGNGNKEGYLDLTSVPATAKFVRFSTNNASHFVKITYALSNTIIDAARRSINNEASLKNLDIYSDRIFGYPFEMTFIGDSLTAGQTYVNAQGNPDYVYLNKANYPDVFKRILQLDTKTVIAVPGASSSSLWSSKSSEIAAVHNQFVIVWLGTNGGLTDTVDTDCAGDDPSQYANTNTGNYGKIIKTLMNNGNKVFIAQLCYTSQLSANAVILDLADKFGCDVLTLSSAEITDLNDVKYHTAYNNYFNAVHFNSIGYNHVAGLFFNKMMAYIKANPVDYEIYIPET